jgi:glyoxylase-like metal-dependent hydrolase (beta-lactamase superfamily II)
MTFQTVSYSFCSAIQARGNFLDQQRPIHIALPFEQEGGSVNVYLFVEPEPVLVDAGFNSAAGWAALQAALATHGLSVADLQRVIITHPHVDHYGLAAAITNRGPAEVWMAEVGSDWLRNFPVHQQRRIDYYRDDFLPGLGLASGLSQSLLDWLQGTLSAWQPIPSERVHAFPIDQSLMLGGLPWQVLHLQGHDSHLTAFYQAETRQLLATDALMIPTATPVVEAPPPGQPRPPALPQMIDSLRQLAVLEVDQVYPGHGAPFADHRTVIQSQLRRIEERKEEAYRHLVAGAATVAELFPQLYGARASLVGPAGLWMTVGYLDLLVAEGRVEADRQQRVWRFSPRLVAR